MWKKRFIITLWIVFAAALTALTATAIGKEKQKPCRNIIITMNEQPYYIQKQQLLQLLAKYGIAGGVPIYKANLLKAEVALKKMKWIEKAELYFDNTQTLHVIVKEKQPIARIFTVNGESFFIDSLANRLPYDKHVVLQLPVVTGFTSHKEKLSSPDSLLLENIKQIALYIQKDSFWKYMAAQINITAQNNFEILPAIGNQVIELGNAENLEDKFNRLYSFYKQVWAKGYYDKYAVLKAQYNGQIVAVRKDNIHIQPATDSAQQTINNNTFNQFTTNN